MPSSFIGFKIASMIIVQFVKETYIWYEFRLKSFGFAIGSNSFVRKLLNQLVPSRDHDKSKVRYIKKVYWSFRIYK